MPSLHLIRSSPSLPQGTAIAQSGVPIIQKINKAIEEKRPFYSFEYFPPKTADGVKNLYSRLDRMSTLEVCGFACECSCK